MTHAYGFLENLSMVLGVAALTTLIFHKLRQPVILGYLLAGMIIGPYVAIPLIADAPIVHELAELGVILLMFSIGLEFNLRKLFRLFPSAGLIAFFQCSLMMGLGYGVAVYFGWTASEGFYTGAIIAISSTTIIAKVFKELKMKGALPELVYGVLILEDLIAVLLLVLVPLLSSAQSFSATHIIRSILGLVLFLVVVLVLGFFLVPRFIRSVIRLNRPEITIISNVGLCFSAAFLALSFGYSVALGAFLAGALVAESREEKRIELLIQPIRDIFAAVFFVAVGMLINPTDVLRYWQVILILSAIVILGKTVGVTVGALLARRDLHTAMRTGLSLAQIGEFSFIIAGAGIASHAIGEFLYPIAVVVSALTTLTTPWLIKYSETIAGFVTTRLPLALQKRMALSSRLTPEADSPALNDFSNRIVEILPGFGAVTLINLGKQSPLIGKTLSEVNLRSATGASVIAIQRKNSDLVIPSGSEVLCPEDTLALVGSKESMDEVKKNILG